MSFNNIQNIIAENSVMNATLNSSACILQKIYNFSILVSFTGTPTGTFKLQASCDPFPNGNFEAAPTNWNDIANSSFSVVAAGSVQWNYSMCGFNYVRVVYTDGSSGESTAIITSATFNGK